MYAIIPVSGLKRQYNLTNWYDREILPGEQWEKVIDTHLSTADVILLLISLHFVDSDYCYGKEMQRALERHFAGDCCVIPILLRPTYWEDTPLGTIQMLPTDARAITKWPDRDEAFHDVARGVGAAIKSILTARTYKAREERLDRGYIIDVPKHYEKVPTAFERALHIDPNPAFAYYNKGHAFLDNSYEAKNLSSFEQSTHLFPDEASSYVLYG